MIDQPKLSAYNKLSPKRRLFVDKYLLCLNKTQAAKDAGYSSKTAKEQGYKLFTNVHVKQAIDDSLKILAEENKLEVSEIIDDLRNIKDLNPLDVYSWTKDGDGLIIKNSKDIPYELGKYISSITQSYSPTGAPTIIVKFCDKTKALELLGKYLKMFTDKHELSTDNFTLIFDDKQSSDDNG